MRAAIATPHHLASETGRAVLAGGGNALDAAVAANLVLGVVTPYLCGFGGDLFAIVWTDRAHGYNGSGRAPAAVTPEEFRARAGDAMPLAGAHTVTVPGAVRGWFDLLERFGSRSFGELATAALAFAREGFEVSARGAFAFERSCERFADEEEFVRVYGGARAGSILRQLDLARTIETLASEGPGAFYRGSIGEAIVATLRARDGLMTEADLASHAGDWVEPLRAGFGDLEVLELPPNTQGACALEALRIVDGLDLPPDGPDRHHLLIEAMRLALADRDRAIGDPDAMTECAEALFGDANVGERRARIDPARARIRRARAAAGGTAYLCAADASGMCVSLIQSNWMGAGSGVTVPGWGVNLHNRGNFFSLEPSSVNAIGPRKRPLHTLIPGLALRDGEPALVFGTMGGDGQAQTHLQLLTRVVLDGLDERRAIDAPRWVIDPGSGDVSAEQPFGEPWFAELRSHGHVLHAVPEHSALLGHAHMIGRRPPGWTAASDPRSEGAALGL